ncbi:MAG TPA: 50S ribosomal protein L4 [Candidatus Paceibacterota bacterium]|jgi:large subunit ribosomal protein L4
MATEKETKAKGPAKAAAKKAPAKAAAKAPAKKEAPSKKIATPKPEKAAKPAAGLEATVYSATGSSAGTITLPEALFGAQWNADLVHQVVVGMQANARPTVANTKFRGEVRGGGRKPWKQKGTGRARHGSRRSPIWVGGGVTHGPRAEKVYAVKINRKMRAAALASVLSRKWADGEVIFVERFAFDGPKTKDAKSALVAIAKGAGQEALATRRTNAALIALPKKDAATEKSFRNLTGIVSGEVRNLNPVDLMTKKYLVIAEPAEAFTILGSRLTKKA